MKLHLPMKSQVESSKSDTGKEKKFFMLLYAPICFTECIWPERGKLGN